MGWQAVAKGIRRVTAVTSQLAAQAHATGDALSARLDALGTVPKAELGPELAGLKQELDAAVMSYGRKGQLRAQHDALTKEYMAAKKKMAAEQANVAIAAVEEQLGALAGAKVAVLEVDVGGDAKMLQSVMKAAVKAAPGVALALATRDDAGKGALLCQAPDAGAPRLLAVGDRWREGERRGDTAVTPPAAVSLERTSVYADRGCGERASVSRARQGMTSGHAESGCG